MILLFNYPIHIVPLHMKLEAIPHLKPQPGVFNLIDNAYQATTGNDPIPFFEIGQHLLGFLALLLLGAKDQEIENKNQRQKQKQ